MIKKFCERCGKELKTGEQFCTECGYKVNQNENGKKGTMRKKQSNKLIRVIGIVLVVVVLLMIIGAITGNNKSSVSEVISVSEFIEKYNIISQKYFAAVGITEADRPKISIEDLKYYNAGTIDNESLTMYSYTYEGLYQDPVCLGLSLNDEGMVRSLTVSMNGEFIMGNDDFITMVLDSAIEAFCPSLEEEEIQEIKGHFSMDQQLVGAMISDRSGSYNYGGKTYIVSTNEGNLHFEIFPEEWKLYEKY